MVIRSRDEEAAGGVREASRRGDGRGRGMEVWMRDKGQLGQMSMEALRLLTRRIREAVNTEEGRVSFSVEGTRS